MWENYEKNNEWWHLIGYARTNWMRELVYTGTIFGIVVVHQKLMLSITMCGKLHEIIVINFIVWHGLHLLTNSGRFFSNYSAIRILHDVLMEIKLEQSIMQQWIFSIENVSHWDHDTLDTKMYTQNTNQIGTLAVCVCVCFCTVPSCKTSYRQ